MDPFSGPNKTTVQLFRNPVSADKIFVEAKLPDGSNRLFLVDTGAALSIVSHQVALELGLEVTPRAGRLVGVAGSSPWSSAQMPSLRVGAYTFRDISVAVGVRGIPTHVGLVPLAGILGNDVLGDLEVAIDYPAGTMDMARPGYGDVPDTASALFFNGEHPRIKTTLTARDRTGVTVEQPVLLEVDTGARGILLQGGTLTKLKSVASRGTELVAGAGAAVPVRAHTLRVPVVKIPAGGTTLETELNAIWLDHDEVFRRHSPEMPGLLGYAALKNHRVVIDYPGKRFALDHSAITNAPVDVHEWFIERGKPSTIDRIKSLIVLGRTEEANRQLERLSRAPAKYPEAAILYARIKRRAGHLTEASAALEGVPMRALATSGEIISMVNALWLSGEAPKATQTALLATTLEPGESSSWIAAADERLSRGDAAGAREAVAEATAIIGDPNSFRIRRALIAWIDGDVDGALTHLRQLVTRNPTQGYPQWLYARFADNPDRRSLAAYDLERAEKRAHPTEVPFDFAAGAWSAMGDEERMTRLADQGMARDCERAKNEPSRDNCMAWYQALGGHDLAIAEELVRKALKEQPSRSEFLDTLAIILEAQGRPAEAREASRQAALHQPDDAYLVTQAIRLWNDARRRP